MLIFISIKISARSLFCGLHVYILTLKITFNILMIEKLWDKMGKIHCNFCECKNICLHIILSILFTPKNDK